MNITYRRINANDYSFLREMLYEALFLPEGEEPFDKSILDSPHISKYIDNWGTPGDFGFIIQINNVLIGAAWVRLYNEDNKGYGFVNNDTPELSIAIKSEYRNRGFGKELMSRIFQCAKEKGYRNISLSVDKRNRATNFYKMAGFRIVEELDTAYTMIIDL